ncbi:MAG: helix-hairpin-helix domain-containing protein [Cyclobacteriaceae bacterium]
MKRSGLIGLMLMVLVTLGYSQPNERVIDLERFIEYLFQVQDIDVSYEDLYESLYLLYTNPINLNTTNAEELASIFLLTPNQINNLLNYQSSYGRLLSIYELQAIPDFDEQTIRNLLPFVSVDDDGIQADNRPLFQRITTEENNYFILRYQRLLEDQKGFTPPTFNADGEPSSRYAGSPSKYMGRFRVSHSKDFSLGFTFEKDAGEQFWWDPNSKTYGLDYFSYHLHLQNKGKFKTIALGDYQIQMGQGLVFGAGFSPGKGAESITTVRRGSTGVRPYASVLETGFFRGAASTVTLGNFEVSGYFSRLYQDASIRNDTTFSDLDEFVSSIQDQGFHRTQTEIAAKDRILEFSYGSSIVFSGDSKRYQLGANILNTQYSLPLFRRPNNYNQFEFGGNQNLIYSLFGSYLWQNFNLFGEVAQSSSGGIGAVAGFMTSLSKLVDFSMVFRNYQRDFHSFYGNGFGESSRSINEQGVYWGIKIKPSRKIFFSAYYDKFRFPWLRFRTEAPSDGYEYLARFNYRPARSVLLYFQLRQEEKQLTIGPDNSNLNVLETGRKNNYLLNLDYSVNKWFTMKSRVQYSNYDLAGQYTEGIALIQDFNFEFWKMKLSSRFAIFDTDDYENRQYVYERDVLYGFSIPAYNGLGTRNYILLQYNHTRKLNFWIRYAKFNYRGVDSIGSGLDEIDDNTRTEIKVQMRIKL